MPEYIEGGNVGYLDTQAFSRFQWAVHDASKLVAWLRVAGYIRAGDPDEVRHRSTDRPLGLPPTWIAAEEISRLLGELNGWPDLEDAANDQFGAYLATELTKEVETSSARWPFEDRPHKVQYLRCQACDRMSLRYVPPRTEGGEIVVQCREKDCRAILPERMFERVVVMAKAEHERRERVGRVGNRREGSGNAGPFGADNSQVGVIGEGGDFAPDARVVA